MIFRPRYAVLTLILATTANAHAQAADDDDDDDDNDSSSVSSEPAKPTSIFHENDDAPTCTLFETGRRVDTRRAAHRETALELLEAVAHANDPLLARHAYDALYLADEKGTPGEDFNKASDAHKDWAASHPDQVKWLADPAHAKQFAELLLALRYDGDDRLLQAASSAGDPLLLEKLHPLLADEELTKFHDGWVERHPQFVADMSDPAKAKQFIDRTLVVLRGTDDEHRAWYAARHSPVPSLAPRVRAALLLDGARASVFDPAQDEWEKAHAKELGALTGDAATTFVAQHLGVGPAPAVGSDDDHVLYAAASASDDAVLLSQTKRQLDLVDFGGPTDQGDRFLEAHGDWQTTHTDALSSFIHDKAAAATYVRSHVKAPAWGFPEDNLKLYVAATHAPDKYKAESNVLKGLKLTDKCEIHKFTGQAGLYETEHPEFAATVATPETASAYVKGHLDASTYTDPSSLEGFAVGVGVGLGFPFDNRKSGAVSMVLPIELTAEYRFSPRWAFGGYASYGSVSTSCQMGMNCSGFTVRIGGELGYNLSQWSKYEPWLHFGAGWSHLTIEDMYVNPVAGGNVDVTNTADAFELHVRAQATVISASSMHAGPLAAFQYSMFDDGVTLFVLGFGGAFVP